MSRGELGKGHDCVRPSEPFCVDRDRGLFVATVRWKEVPASLRGIPTAQVTAHKACLLPTLEYGFIEMAPPKKPNSWSQRYRLMEAGKELRARPGTGRSG